MAMATWRTPSGMCGCSPQSFESPSMVLNVSFPRPKEKLGGDC